MDGWFQSFLLRQSGVLLKDDDNGDDVRAGAKPTVMTFCEASNEHYCVHVGLHVIIVCLCSCASQWVQ